MNETFLLKLSSVIQNFPYSQLLPLPKTVSSVSTLWGTGGRGGLYTSRDRSSPLTAPHLWVQLGERCRGRAGTAAGMGGLDGSRERWCQRCSPAARAFGFGADVPSLPLGGHRSAELGAEPGTALCRRASPHCEAVQWDVKVLNGR